MKTSLPRVKIGKITLREITRFDYLDYFEIGKDSITTKDLNWGPFLKPKEALWAIDEVILKRPKDGLPVGYAIIVDNKMVGIIDYHTYYKEINAVEVGYILHRDYWNQGIMSRCLKEIVKIGFNHLEVDKIIVGHLQTNEASRHVILNCGFKYESQKITAYKDKEGIVLYYSIYKYEFEGGN